jgi:hypothetical protein
MTKTGVHSELDMFSLSASKDEDGIQSLMKIQMFG